MDSVRIKDDIGYLEYLDILNTSNSDEQLKKTIDYYVIGDITKIEPAKLSVLQEILMSRLKSVKDIQLTDKDNAIMLLMTFGMPYADACRVPARIAMSYIKQQTGIRVKQLEDQQSFLALQQDQKKVSGISLKLFDNEAAEILAAAKKEAFDE